MANKKFFSWSNFSLTFLKAVVYSQTTPHSLKPETTYTDKDFLVPYQKAA